MKTTRTVWQSSSEDWQCSVRAACDPVAKGHDAHERSLDGDVGCEYFVLQSEIVICAVAIAFGLSRHEMLPKKRRGGQSIILARQIAMYLCRTVLQLPVVGIGQVFERHYTTVRHSCAAVEMARDDPVLDARIMALEEFLRPVLCLPQS